MASLSQRASGSIPACAGEPWFPSLNIAAMKVYPRVCGGTDLKEGMRLLAPGLSPRVRGNRGVARMCHANEGSIPACAGEPVAQAIADSLPPVYPRVCGGTGGA